MQIEDIIRKVTLEVLRQLNELTQKRVLIPFGTPIDQFEDLEGVEFVTWNGEDALEEILEGIDTVIIPEIDMNDLANVAMGQITSHIGKMLVTGLMTGKNVLVLAEGLKYRQYEASAPKALYEMYQSYENKLFQFGAKVIEKHSIAKFIGNTTAPVETRAEVKKSTQAYDISQKKLIDYSLVKYLYDEKTDHILVSKKAIVTAMAKDFIKDQDIKIEMV